MNFINMRPILVLTLFAMTLLWQTNATHALDMSSDKGQNIGAGRAVLVTGASSGIGKQIAITLSEQGF